MDIKINSGVVTHSGQEIGKVARLVFDPNTYGIDQLVVATDRGERVVPLNMIESAATGIVRLRVDSDVVYQLSGFNASEYEEAPESCPAVTKLTSEQAYPPSTFLLSTQPAATVMPTPAHAEEAIRPEPKKRFAISVGTEVMALDGRIGVVDEVLTDQYQDKVLGLMVRAEGSDKGIRVPIEWVSSLSSGCVHLSMTKEQLEKHPLPPDGMYIPTEPSQPTT